MEDVIANAEATLREVDPQTAEDVRMAGRPMIYFSDALWADLKVIRRFLFTRMYRAPEVMIVREAVTEVVRELFPMFMENTDLLPKQWRQDVASARDSVQIARIVSDYISGMTDRFALMEYERLTGRAMLPETQLPRGM